MPNGPYTDPQPKAESDGDLSSGGGRKAEGDLSDVGAALNNAPPEGNLAGMAGRPGFERVLSEEDMREVNARLLEEAEHAAPFAPDSDTGTNTASETPARSHTRTGTTTAAAGTSATTPGGDKTIVEVTKMRGCAKRMKEHFIVSQS